MKKKHENGLPALSSTSTRHVTLQQNKRKGTAIEDVTTKKKESWMPSLQETKDIKGRQICTTCKPNICRKYSQIICNQGNHK